MIFLSRELGKTPMWGYTNWPQPISLNKHRSNVYDYELHKYTNSLVIASHAASPLDSSDHCVLKISRILWRGRYKGKECAIKYGNIWGEDTHPLPHFGLGIMMREAKFSERSIKAFGTPFMKLWNCETFSSLGTSKHLVPKSPRWPQYLTNFCSMES